MTPNRRETVGGDIPFFVGLMAAGLKIARGRRGRMIFFHRSPVPGSLANVNAQLLEIEMFKYNLVGQLSIVAIIFGLVVSSASAALSVNWVSTPVEIDGTAYCVLRK